MKRPQGKRRTRLQRLWSESELRTLQREWGEVRQRFLKKKLPGRTWVAILLKAEALGLPFGIPQGFLSLNAAARHLGLSISGLRALCVRQHVTIEQHPFRDRRAKGTHWLGIEQAPLEEAFARDCEYELPTAAARRMGLYHKTLVRWLRREGLIPALDGTRKHFRVLSADIERVVAERRGGSPATTSPGSTPTSQMGPCAISADGSARPRADQTEKFAREITANPANSHASGNVRRAA